MHRKITIRRFRISRLAALIVSGVAILAIGGGIAAASAGASSMTVTASTQVSNHPDTTNVSGGACNSTIEPQNGPVWAFDAYTSQMTAVNTTGTDTWHVTIQDKGSFAGFADPANCNAMTSKGSLLGLYTVTVTSTHTPSQATLQSSYSGPVGTTQMVQDFFGDPSAAVSGGDYFFVYQGGNYVQTTNSIYGDVIATEHHGD